MITKTKEVELSNDQILDLADAEGSKLGFLIAASPFDEKTKQAIVDVLDTLSLEQIRQVSEFFETEYLNAKNKPLNDWLKKTLEDIKVDFDKKEKDLDDATMAKLDELEKKM